MSSGSLGSQREEHLDLIFHALSSARRRSIIQRLSEGPAIVRELGASMQISKPGLGKHIKVLEKAGLLKRTEDGRVHRCTLDPECLKAIDGWLRQYRQFWTSSLDNLDQYVNKLKQ